MAVTEMKRMWLPLLVLTSILAVSRSEESAAAVAECVYSFYVKTADFSAAGTDTKISATFYDPAGNWIRIGDVEAWGGKMGPGYDYFEQGQSDIFSGKGPCLPGPVCSLKVTSDGSGFLAAWYVTSLELTVTGYEKNCGKQLFSLNAWLLPPFALTVTKNNCARAFATAGEVTLGLPSDVLGYQI